MPSPSSLSVVAPLLAIWAAGVQACSSPQVEPMRSSFDTASIDAYFRKLFPPDEPGGAVLVAKGGRVVFARGYGLADLRTRTPITTRTLFNTGSISKTFVANAILILQEEGALSVDDRLATYFAFKNPDLAARISLRHLLTHTSGLPDDREVAKNTAFFLTAKDRENWYPVTQAESLDFEPGSRFAYSNPAFNGLALVVEKVSGTRWQSFVRTRIFLPAGMNTSTITDGSHPATGVAHAYERVGRTWAESDHGEVPTFAAAGNGGVWSSVEELALYERALATGAFLSRQAVLQSRTVKTFDNWVFPEPPTIGWSWFIGRTKQGDLRTIGHTGSQGGFRAIYVTVPEKSIFYVVLSNVPFDRDAAAQQIETWLRARSWLEGDWAPGARP